MSKGISGLIGDALQAFVYQPYLLDKTREMARQRLQDEFNFRREAFNKLGITGVQPSEPQAAQVPVLAAQPEQQSPVELAQAPTVQQPNFFERLSPLIMQGEVPAWKEHGFSSPYDVPFAYGSTLAPDKPLTQMTLGEVKDYQQRLRPTTGKNTSAVGAYQMTQPFLESGQKRLGLPDDTPFTPEVQNQIAQANIQDKLDQYQKGEIDQKQLQDYLSSQWASLQNSAGQPTYPGQAAPINTDMLFAAADVKNEQQNLAAVQNAYVNTQPGIRDTNDLATLAETGQTPKEQQAEIVRKQIPRTRRAEDALISKYVNSLLPMAQIPGLARHVLPSLTSASVAQAGALDRQIQQQQAGYAKRPEIYSNVKTNPTTGITTGLNNLTNRVERIPGYRGAPTQAPPTFERLSGLNKEQFVMGPNGPVKIGGGPRFNPNPNTVIDMGSQYVGRERAKLGTERYYKLNEQLAGSAALQMQMEDALKNIEGLYTGIGGKLTQDGRKVLAALGLGDMAENAGKIDAFQAVSQKMAQQMMSQQAMGPYSDKDLQFVIDMVPNIGHTKEGAQLIFEAYKRQNDLVKGFVDFVRESGSPIVTPELEAEYYKRVQASRKNEDLRKQAQQLAEKQSQQSSGGTANTGIRKVMEGWD